MNIFDSYNFTLHLEDNPPSFFFFQKFIRYSCPIFLPAGLQYHFVNYKTNKRTKNPNPDKQKRKSVEDLY